MRQQILIDTDPGPDDALAILLALSANDVLDIVGLTAVAGNVPVAQTCLNALKICDLAGAVDLPVYAGCEQPIMRSLHTAEFICGQDGLAGMALPEPGRSPETQHAVNAIIDLLRQSKAPLTVCALGPLTNIAMVLRLAPDLASKIDRLLIMGGARDLGNITAAAEFNFFVDPHAAAIVFNAGIPITLFPLNATYQAVASAERLSDLDATAPIQSQVLSMLQRDRAGGAALGGDKGHPMHDPCVIAYLLWPDLFEGRDCHVSIETAEGATVGRSTIDWWGRSAEPANAHVIGAMDADQMFAGIAASLRSLDKSLVSDQKAIS